MKKRNSTSIASSFWMNQDPTDMFAGMSRNEKKSSVNAVTMYRIASHRRAIANFVHILTGKQIPVHFRTDNRSYTDSKHVVIGSNIVKPKDFDVAVGVALHEASHILLTDFGLFGSSYDLCNQIVNRLRGNETFNSVEEATKERGFDLISTFKDLINIIEDRRIDSYVYRSAPGYREYYLSMYDKYFNDSVVDKAMRGSEKREENFDSYLFRIINLHSIYTDVTALKQLEKIAELIDLKNIDRFKSTSEVADTAMEVLRVLIEAIPPVDQQAQDQKESGQGKSSDEESGDEEAGNDGSGDGSGDGDDSADGEEVVEVETEDGSGSGSDANKNELTERQKKQLKKLIEKQKKFLEGDTQKTKVSKKEEKELKGIAESDSKMESVGDSSIGKTECIVVRRFTQSLIDSGACPFANKYSSTRNAELIERGFRYGKQLVNKIKTRSEERETVYNRQKTGRIDRRMLSSLGYGYESVFYTNEIDKYKKAIVHISLDLSWSMRGERFDRAFVTAIAMAVAFDQIPNIDIQISLRGVMFTSEYRGRQDDSLPYVIIAYDSRTDKLSKIKTLFQYIDCNGTTPEGLCFEAIQDEIVASAKGIDSYFVNLSDGEPYYSNTRISYSGEDAARHTKREMDKMRAKGIKILSYFVGDARYGANEIFRMSYGKDTSFIDVNNVTLIAKTVNEMLMEK